AMSASPDGQVLMYRSISRETGRSRLHLVDYRDAKSPKKVASDGRPGVESLHPIAGRNFDINGDSIAYVARHRDRDVIYRQDYSQKVDKLSEEELEEREERRSEEPDAPDKEDRTATERAADRVSSVRFDLSERVRYRLDDWDIIAVDTVAFEPDGDRIAFVGLEQDGYKDLYVLDPGEDDEQFSVERITDDEYAEREVSWGEEGIVFTSDATDDGHYNVFWADPESKEIERLTYEERDHTSPRMLDDGRVYFVAYDEVGANIYHAVGPGLTRKTGVASALSDLSPGPRDGMWTLQYYQGRQRPARVPSDRLLDGDVSAQTTNGSVYELPERSLDEATDYNVWDLDSWEIGNFFGILGASTQGVAGQVYASANDELRDHVMVLNLLAAGSLETVDGSLVYFNQEDRLIWGGGVFQDVGFRYDRTFEDDDEVDEFISSERFFGASGTVRYPFDRFRFLQGSLAVGGINYFLYDGTEECLKTPDCLGRDVHDEWEEANDGVRFQIEPSVSLGYNTLRYHPQTGPFGGHSMLLSGTYDWQPFRERGYGTARLDAEKYWSLWGRTNFFLRSGLGYTFGGRFARSFFLSSYDTLRGVRWGNFDYLLGQSFLFSTAELQFPLNFIVDVPIIDLEGVLALDAGGVGGTGEEIDQVWDNRIFNYVLGTNFGLGPIVLRLHFAKTFDIGVKRPQDGDWATNLSVNWRYW
ncbi:MAG: tolB protein precursor protein, partial [Persicimonas sp.]